MLRKWRGPSIATSIAVATLLAAGCGSRASDERGREPAAPPGYWVAGRVPPGFQLLNADDSNEGVHSATYGRPRYQTDTEGPLGVATLKGAAARYPPFSPKVLPGRVTLHGRSVRRDTAITVRGRRGVLRIFEAEGEPNARIIVWTEPSGDRVMVSGKLSVRESTLRWVAQDVRRVSPERWRVLVRGTSSQAQEGRPTTGMKRVPVARGRHAGRAWVLAALLPPDYPLEPVDRRAICNELTYRGERRRGNACVGPPTWARVGGALWIYGQVDASTTRVRLDDRRGVSVGARTYAVPGAPRFRLYAVALPPRASCPLRVETIDRRGRVRSTGNIGPQLYGPEWRRCVAEARRSGQ